jgi:hypothetical protein
MLTGVLIFVLLAVAVLAIPLSLTYDVSSRSGYRNDAVIDWAFGLLQFRIPTDRPTPAPADADNTRPTDNRATRSSDAAPIAFAAIGQKAFRRRLFRFAADLWRAIRKDDVRLNVRLGLSDPADTGQLWAIIGPIAGMLAYTDGAAISIVPDFFDATLEMDSHGIVRLVPLHIISLAVALMLSPAVWQGIQAMRRAR